MNKVPAVALVLAILLIASVLVVFSYSSLIDTSRFEANRDAIRIYSNSDFLPENGVVSGNGTSQDPFMIAGWNIAVAPSPGRWWNSAIYIEETTAHFVIRDITIDEGVDGDGILLYHVSNGVIDSSEINVGLDSVHLLECSWINISESSLRADGSPALWSYRSSNLSISNSDIASAYEQSWSGDLHTMFLIDSAQVAVTNCTIGGELRLDNCTEGFVKRNQFRGDRGGLVLEGTSNTTIAANSFEHRGISFEGGSIEQEAEYYMDAMTNSISLDNSIGGRPIEVHYGESGVTIDDAEPGQAILMNCSLVAVKNSKFTDSYSGVLMIHTSYVTISNCTVSDCVIGIRLIYCLHVQLFGCDVIRNIGAGVSLVACSDGDIYANNIRSNGEQLPDYVGVEPRGWGLLLYNCVDFVIYGNSFENNRIQAGDTKSGEKNLWDRGYPGGGNHWSDYNGIDSNSGSGQDITGSDGVGDTPYQVGHDSGDYWAYATDRYPLMP